MDERDSTTAEPKSDEPKGETPRKAYRAHMEIGTLGRFGAKTAVPVRSPEDVGRDTPILRPIRRLDDDWLAPDFSDYRGDDADEDAEIPQRFWTGRRILYLILAILIVVTLIAEMLSGFFIPPEPPPTLPPMPMI